MYVLLRVYEPDVGRITNAACACMMIEDACFFFFRGEILRQSLDSHLLDTLECLVAANEAGRVNKYTTLNT